MDMRSLLEKRLHEAAYTLSDDQVDAFITMINELKKWNKKVNLTALDTDEEIIIKHIIDSLSLIPYVFAGESLLDVGSGAGFPSIPIKIVNPDILITTVDAVQKKIMFQKHVSRLLGLENISSLHCRVESMYDNYAGFFDVIVSRAFSRLDQFVSLVAPLVKKEGRLIAMKGPDAQREIDESRTLLQEIGFEICRCEGYQLPQNRGERTLITLKPHK